MRLRNVLEATRKANLKCQLGVEELTFVGDILRSEGIRFDLENMPRP